MNLRDLRYLVAVADHRHFGRAAEACFVSQPTLSAQLKKLEEFLGVQRVERTNRQGMLTPIGTEVAQRARYILNTADDIVEVARAASDPFSGDFRLGLIPTVAPYLLPHLVPAMRQAFSRLRPLLYEEQTASCLDKLRRGELDAVILAVPVEGAEGFAQLPLYDEPFLLAVPSDYTLPESQPVPLDRLATERILLLEEGHCLRDQALDVCKLVGAREEREFRATSLETLRQMVASGAGMTLLPELAAHSGVSMPNAGAIRLHRFQDPQPQRHIAILWRKGSAREATVKAVGDTIRQLEVITGLRQHAAA
ncbi:MAG: LysR family transcriptional regulator [Ectothiorhodospiraceae bacterium]|nr:LysR family transcriptional regulator [Ectothiorhodospiraceae bacterium]